MEQIWLVSIFSLRINCLHTSKNVRHLFQLPPFIPDDGLIGLILGQHFSNVLDKNGLQTGFVIYSDL